MGKLQDKLTAEIREATLSRNELKRDNLRFLKGELERAFGRDMSDAAISKGAKKLIDGIVEANSDKGEIEILKQFVLEQLSEAEVKDLVIQYKESEKLSGPKEMGKIMAYFKSTYDGRYDGKTLSDIVKQELA